MIKKLSFKINIFIWYQTKLFKSKKEPFVTFNKLKGHRSFCENLCPLIVLTKKTQFKDRRFPRKNKFLNIKVTF